MSTETPTPKTIWIITDETSETSTTTNETSTVSDARGSGDTGGRLGAETTEEIIVSKKENEIVITRRKAVEVATLKQEMKGFLQAMREMLDEADEPNSKIQLQEVELSVEINGEGKVSLFGVGGKAGGKGAMTFKFKRK
ncbi:MAG: hypothetical protein PUP92_11410 [Rhizonema sp. PD38]|nr:hypothetical protein [Rhizonema sp. PD38]